jgi:signal transduction histidine kinase
MRRGLQREILASLLAVMATATAMLVAVMLRAQQAQVEQLSPIVADAIIDQLRGTRPLPEAELARLRWWRIGRDGRTSARGVEPAPIDAASLALLAEARERGVPLLRAGAFWQPTRVAVVDPDGSAVVGLLPSAGSPALVLGLLLGDVAVFTAFGLTLFRRRLVLPLRRLAATARAIADGALGERAPASDLYELSEVATAFNDMTDALEARSASLEKAVDELRESNRRLREAHAGLDRAERLAAVGQLAAGVAHEVGNPMGAVLGFLDLVRRDPGLSQTARAHADRAVREGERVRRILRQLLDFSRPPQSTRARVDLFETCRETAGLVSAQSRYADIPIELEVQGAPPAASTDRAVAVQILLNLLLNAAEALSGAGTPGPRISVEVRPAAAATRPGDPPEAAAQRRHCDAVECVVRDNGPGIPAQNRERIFAPFFSTKPPGEGTGLGLANARRLAEELGGSLSLLPPADGHAGAAFCLRLPACEAPERQADTRTRAR